MGKRIELVEVGPRDGFQSVKPFIPTERKIAYIQGLLETGLQHVELCSFVSPKAIPQMADAVEVTQTILSGFPGGDYLALAPNSFGAQKAYECGIRKLCYIVSLSESHNRLNVRRSHQESLDGFRAIREAHSNMELILELVTAFGCPFEGKFKDSSRIISFLRDYVEAGLDACCLCDTIGIADPNQVRRILGDVQAAYPELRLEVHFHDTRGLAMLNAITAVESGVEWIQCSAGGLGGLPLLPGSSGNLATEDLVWALEEMGYETGVSCEKLLELAKAMTEEIPGNYSGHQILIGQSAE